MQPVSYANTTNPYPTAIVLSREAREKIDAVCMKIYGVASTATEVDGFCIGVASKSLIPQVIEACLKLDGFTKGGDGNYYYYNNLVKFETQGTIRAC